MESWLFAILCIIVPASNAARCDSPLLEGSEMIATSAMSGREAKRARLHGDGAWTSRFSNVGQSVTVDLGEVYRITRVATQGRAASSEWVSQYGLQYGFNGRDFMDYRGPHGGAWEFRGNSDGDSVASNRLETAVVARFVRLRPTSWEERMSLRLELYGCTYNAVTMSFNGNAFVEKNLTVHQVHSMYDRIQFRFRTAQPNGVMLYSHGAQGDLLALQLVENKLRLQIDLGSGQLTSLSVGSLLDDHLWHDVAIERRERALSLTVDRVRVSTEVSGDFRRLDLTSQLYLGGVPYIKEGVVVYSNFSGCIENFYLNNSNFIAELRDGNQDYSSFGGEYNCPAVHTVPMTFKDRSAYIKVDGNEGQTQLNISFGFRTYEEDGVMAFHKFLSSGYVKVYLQKGRFNVAILTDGLKQPVVLDPFEGLYNDGSWHAVTVALAENSAVTVIDGYPMYTRRLMRFTSGVEYLFGGGLSGAENLGFLGCMRRFSAGGGQHSPLALGPQNKFNARYLLIDACDMEDRCNPNPCEHGGVCRQSSVEFSCDCRGTGYAGAVCHATTNPLSCAQYFLISRSERRSRVKIDVDGSGPLPAFPVTCVRTPEGQMETHLEHDVRGDQLVDGFERRGSFVQDVTYEADMRQVERLVNGSLRCRQELFYACRRSRLLNTPVRQDELFEPYSWWVSRHNEVMDYWGGSQPGSRKCQCGILKTCVDRTKHCNCDSGRAAETSDGGDLMFKEHLPVRQLRFGDTGSPGDSKRGIFRLGSLVCEGDAIFDNTVTFRIADAIIDLPSIDMGFSGDIYFEFKTAKESGTFFHIEGPQDFLKVSIEGGNVIQLKYGVGGVPLSVSVGVSSRLNDDSWHTVLIERNRKQGRLLLDNAIAREVAEPAGPVRSMRFTSKLVVGANTNYRNGFVGCMRALMVNGQLQNIKYLAEHGWHGGPLYGLSAGCQGKCASAPCLNNGTCVEGYSDYTCNCRWTAFKGPICADEIGVSLNRDYMIKYELEGSYKTTISESIRVGFTTTSPSGFLLGLHSDISKEYMTIMVSNSGHIRVVFDFGFERRDVVYPDRIFNEGQFHDVRVRRLNRNGASALQIQVDNYPPYEESFAVNPSADVQFNNIQYLYIGKNESMLEGFVGCISRVEFDDIYPLKLMFQENRPTNIMGSSPKIHEDYCGIQPLRHPEEVPEQRPLPEVDESIVSSLYNDINFAVLAGVLCALLLAVLLVALLLTRRASRLKGNYLTREDAGASDAEDADEAVAQGETGPQVQKMREFFI
ncbi:neurexin-4-like [Pollicipes pollicipes]|uniref:neurexin-4-like n=1 Tax=Pollicipes pollicipes TaxID=41117 RepID=UPI001884F56D|nr:neurexin-4-like [Pollicipes pollicipes]XP_037092009.1 neurexin-4-like [Pollicipes pollicipes]XP_037092010.1 neurexin-4-like [Pollicipes pollicipes]